MNSVLVKYGPWRGFGETVFNLMLSGTDVAAFVRNATKMHCLGVRDKDYNRRLKNFCNNHMSSLVKTREWPVFFAMRGLAKDQNNEYRDAFFKHYERMY